MIVNCSLVVVIILSTWFRKWSIFKSQKFRLQLTHRTDHQHIFHKFSLQLWVEQQDRSLVVLTCFQGNSRNNILPWSFCVCTWKILISTCFKPPTSKLKNMKISQHYKEWGRMKLTLIAALPVLPWVDWKTVGASIFIKLRKFVSNFSCPCCACMNY